MMDKSDFMAQAKAQMDKWADELTKMQAKVKEAGAAGQEQMVKQMEALNQQRKQAEKHMEDLGKANMEAAKEVQDSMQKAWAEMEKSLAEARKKFMG